MSDQLINDLPTDSKLKQHMDFVSLMGKLSKSPKKRERLLSIASPGDIDACAEIYLNLLRGNIKVSKKDLKKLQKYQNQIRALADKKISRHQKKILLGTQTGGLLPLLIPALAPLVISALRGIFGQ